MITDRHTVYTTLWNGGRIGIISPPPSKSDGPSSSRADEIFIDLREVWNKGISNQHQDPERGACGRGPETVEQDIRVLLWMHAAHTGVGA